jgi:hypothetical protein
MAESVSGDGLGEISAPPPKADPIVKPSEQPENPKPQITVNEKTSRLPQPETADSGFLDQKETPQPRTAETDKLPEEEQTKTTEGKPLQPDQNKTVTVESEEADMKGRYNSLDEALGQELKQLIENPYRARDVVRPEELKNSLDEYENDLLKFDAQIVKNVPGVEGKFLYYLEKKLDDYRKVVVVAKDVDFLLNEKTKKLENYSIIDKLIIVGPEGKCVNFAERLPKDTKIIMGFDGTQPEDAMKKSTSNFWYSPATNTVCFGRIDSLSDVAGVLHEGGHAHDFASKEAYEKEMAQSALHVKSKMEDQFAQGKISKATDEIEKKYDMDYLTARYIVAKQERAASLWAISELEKVQTDLGIVPEMADLYKHDIESWWQTYDQFVIPSVGVSEAVRSMGKEQGQAALNHVENYMEMRDWLEQAGIKDEGKMNYSDGEKSLDITLKEGRVCCSIYRPAVPEGDVFEVVILANHTAGLVSEGIRQADGKFAWEKSALDLSDPQEYLKSEPQHKDVLEAEKIALKAIAETVLARETDAIKKAEFMKSAFSPIFPDQTPLDPFEVYKKLAEHDMNSKSSDYLLDSDFEKIATNGITRLAEYEKNLFEALAEKTGKTHLKNYRFDPRDGRPLATTHDKLIYLSEQLLTEAKIPEELPDRSKFESIDKFDEAVMTLAGKYIRLN